MATVPLSGTNIRLLSGVPFSNDYKNTRWFDSKTQQTTYFLNKPIVHSMAQANFQRSNERSFISVNKSKDELWNANYIMFQNASYNNKWFYAFVTKLEYKQINTTYVHFEIDVFQTWKFEMDFKPSFVVREHRPLWNADGSPVINTIDEGLSYGSDYDVQEVHHYKPYDDIFFMVIISKSQMHTTTNEIVPTMNGLPQPLSYYVHPFKGNGDPVPSVLDDGAEGIPLHNPLDVLKGIFKIDDAVNNVVSVYITDYIGLNVTFSEEYQELQFDSNTFSHQIITDGELSVSTIYVKSIPDYNEKTETIGAKYDSYKPVKESKLLMYPYTVLTMDDFKGNRVTLKNEYINNPNIEMMVRGSLGTSNKVVYSVMDYLTTSGLDYGETLISLLENSVINNNANDLPILNDYLSAYLQGNRNSLENQKNQAIFNGITSVAGSAVNGVGSAGVPNPIGVAGAGVGAISGAGSAVLQLQGIEAKKQDVANIPPQMVKMGGNTQFDYGNNINGVYLVKKQIKQEYIDKLTDFFNMFGYKTNEVKIPNFHTRQYWNYVETKNCNILGNFNHEDINDLKTVFDNGITLWHTDDIGNYALENEVI
jgi:hypothetical protein